MAQPISRVPRQVSRRRFLTLSVALGASSALLAACAPAAPAAKPTEAPKPAAPAAAPTTAPAAPAAAAKPTEAPKPAEKPAEAKPAAPAPTTAPAAAAKPAAGEPRRGGTIRISMDGDWKTLDAALYQNITDRQLLYSLYNSLVQLDDKLNVIPSLAESWEVAPDALSWTFKLRSGVKFHDGTPFNAAAVKFNIERIMNPDTASRLRAELLDLQEVQAPDDTTVKFILKQPFTPLLGWMAEVPGFMSSPTAIQKWGKEYGDHPVATGPFEFVEQVKGDHLTLKRFEGYWEQGVPYVDGVVFRPIPDPSTKLAGLRAGSLDLVDDVPPREQAGLANNPEIQLAPNQSTRWPMIRLNLGAAPMDNKAFRQALSMAVDRDGIIKAIYFGNATPAYGPIAPIYSAYYDPGISEYGLKFDLAKAKAKMAESGVSTPVTVRLDMQGTPEYTRMAEIIKATWAEIGVNAEISAFDSNTLTDRMRNASFQASIGSWTPRPDVDGVVYRHYRTGSAFNYLKYSEPAVDQMLDQSRRLPPGPERVKVFQDIQKRIVDDAPWIFLVFENQAYAMSKSVQGLPIIPDTMIRPKTVWLRQ